MDFGDRNGIEINNRYSESYWNEIVQNIDNFVGENVNTKKKNTIH